MTILFYGRLADLVGARVEMDLVGGQSIQGLREALADQYPELADPLRSNRIHACIGENIVLDDHAIAVGDVVEFFPPVSGG